MNNKILIASALAVVMPLTGCDDFLTQQNTTQANQETYFDSDAAVESAIFPLYNYVWNDFNNAFYFGMGDGRANNITARWSDYIYPYTNFTETSLSTGLESAWGSLYSVVAQSNYTIANIEKYSAPAVTAEAKTRAIAEARFMRGLAYWYIAELWGKAIIYTNTSEQVANSVVPAHRGVDVVEFALRDIEFAAAHLPKSEPAPGRITCYSAYGMLSRLYLDMAGLTTDGQYDGSNIATDFNRGTRNTYYLTLARKAAEKAINEGPYKLLADYEDLFRVKTMNNNSESLFQLQWLTGSTDAIKWGCNNAISAYMGWSTMVCETNWGGATYASWDLVRTYDPKDKVRRHATIATVGAVYKELNVKNGGYIYNETETGYEGKCCIKKHVYGKLEDNGQSYQQSSGVNTYMLRLAEVYLNLAEAVLANDQETKDPVAVEAINKVRTRAGMPALKKVDYDALHYERRIELALEGQYWYDLVRRGYYKRQEVINYVNNQERNASYTWNENEPCQYEMENEGVGVAQATEANMTLPISDIDRGRNPELNGDAVPYQFGEREVSQQELFN